MTKVLVTGASGFIGKNLIPKLHSCQHEIIEISSIAGDIADKTTWSHFERVDVLIHLAGSTFVPDSWEDPNGFLKTNFHGTVCALDYCRQHGARLVYLSSYLYGNPSKLPIPESAPPIANNPYALSKKLAEEVCKFYADIFGVKTTIFRPFNVYGSGQSEQFLIPSLINQVIDGNAICVKDLEPRRDYIYIDDLVDAIIMAVGSKLDFEIFNIGTGVSHSVSDLIDLIQNIKDTNLNVQADGERRPEEVMDTQADITKALEVLGWAPNYSLRSGLEKMLRSAG
jgi:GDP-4-dehydro-6-deoxy-D-mannose reductase